MEKKNEEHTVVAVTLMSNLIQISDREGNIQNFPLSVVTLSLEDAGAAHILRLMSGAAPVYAEKVAVTPYSQEIPGVIYVDRIIHIRPFAEVSEDNPHSGNGPMWEVSAL